MYFSVIIPIYNNESFIKRGLNGLLSQTFRDFEIILIDDESKDNSGKICEEFKSKYNNITVIHQKNTGAGGARNSGIEHAKGKYLAFFDIDDMVDSDWLEKMHLYLCKFSPELLIFGYKEINNKYRTEINYKFDHAFFKSNEELKENFIISISPLRFNNGFVWNKIYNREFIVNNNIRFPNLRIQQDEVFNLKVYPKVSNVLIVEDTPYHYFVYYKHNTASHYIPDRLEIYRKVRDSFFEFQKRWNLKDERLTQYIYNRFYQSLLHDLKFNLFHEDNNLTKNQKLEILKGTSEYPDVIETISKLESFNLVPKSYIDRFFFHAIKKQDVSLFLRTQKLERGINFSKILIKKIIK